MKNYLVLVIISFMSIQSFAGKTLDQCLEKAESNLDSKICLANETRSLEATLAKIMKNAVHDSGFEGKEALEVSKRLAVSHKTWLAHRESTCTLAGIQMLGGSGEGGVYLSCMVDETQRRIKELKSIFAL